MVMEVTGQELMTNSLSDYQETVWISTDRHLYIPGEDIDLQIVILEQDTYHLSVLSRYVRVELLNESGQAIFQKSFRVERSKAHMTLPVPGDAASGCYYVKAYTNWMRKSDLSVQTAMVVKVINPNDENLGEILMKKEVPQVQIFASETLTGIFVGFDEYSGIEVSGRIINDQNEEILFKTHGSGWTSLLGNFDLNSSAFVSLDGYDDEKFIPVLKQSDSGSDMAISSDQKYLYVQNPDIHNNPILIIQQSYTPFWRSEAQLGQAQWKIPKQDLPEGIFKVSVVNQEGLKTNSQFWSQISFEQIGSDSIIAKNLGTRQIDHLEYSLPVDSAFLSVMVSLLEPKNEYDYYLPGLPGWPCTGLIPNEEKAFQGWLLAQSFSERNGYSNSTSDIVHLPEINAMLVEGRVRSAEPFRDNKKIGVCINILNDNTFEEAPCDSTGYFYFSLSDQQRSTDFLLSLTSSTDESYLIEAFPPFQEHAIKIRKSFTITQEEIDFLKAQNIRNQLNEAYYKEQRSPEDSIIKNFEKKNFFDPPDFTIILDRYIKLANVREVVYEVVPNVSVKTKNGKSFIKVYNDQTFSEGLETLVLLDGIPIHNQDEVLRLSPDRIEKIEVKNKVYVHGRVIYSSIVNFISPNSDFAGISLPETYILSSLIVPTLELEKIATSDYPETLPRLNETLFWDESQVYESGTIRIQTNDIIGVFRARIFGFDPNGRWIYWSSRFNVGG